MFNSAIIDTAIGIVFVYLLLSLVCSAIGEAIEAVIRNRATDLERGIRELLTDQQEMGGLQAFVVRLFPGLKTRISQPTASPTTSPVTSPPQPDPVAELYDHPLLNGLFRGSYQDVLNYRSNGFIQRFFQWIWNSSPKLPTYIPARNFALALLDVAAPGNAVDRSGAAGALADPKTFVTSSPPGNPIEQLRNTIIAEGRIPPDSKLGRALLTLIDAAGNDVNKARENIENWFDSGMDRASGWYKRRAQFIIFGIGLIVSIAVNADTIYVVKKLSTDKSLRESVAAAAVEYAKANAQPTPTPSTQMPPSTQTAGTAPAGPTPTPTPCAKTECEGDKKDSLACKVQTNKCAAEACWQDDCKDQNSPRCKLAKSRCQLDNMGLPIGWVGNGDILLTWPGWHWKAYGGWWSQLYWHGIGWLLTALAISLGAPFWFDLLNKFIVIRSTVKPKEKSPEEKPKG